MKNVFIITAFFMLLTGMSSGLPCPKAHAQGFSEMEKLWCTVDYKHWAISYPDRISYNEIDFYLYLDTTNKEVYDENKEEMAKTELFGEKEIKFLNSYHANKKIYTANYTLNRYTGRIKGSGTIRHDYGKWASITYENRDFEATGQCAVYSDERKF